MLLSRFFELIFKTVPPAYLANIFGRKMFWVKFGAEKCDFLGQQRRNFLDTTVGLTQTRITPPPFHGFSVPRGTFFFS